MESSTGSFQGMRGGILEVAGFCAEERLAITNEEDVGLGDELKCSDDTKN
jgi:hypothetical protein